MCSKSDLPLRVESGVGKSLIVFAFFIFLGVSLWFTPLPNAPEISCDRPCHELEWPRICRLKFIFESLTFPTRNCSAPSGQCLKEEFHYNAGDKLLTVNRQIPGPKIHVCVHDIILVDVVNRLPDTSVSVHWRGQVHRNEALMDGVPMITQCPIPSYTTFQYKFRASDSGTHIWHLHYKDNGPAYLNNIYGMLVVREPSKTEPHDKLINYDNSEHTIILKAIAYPLPGILINGRHGKAKVNERPEFHVERNKNYRFRIAHSGGDIQCAIGCQIDGHKLRVIALDGNPIEPVHAFQIVLVPGERLDFVLSAEMDAKMYDINFSFMDECEIKHSSFALLNYTTSQQEKTKISKQNQFNFKPVFSTVLNDQCDNTTTCLENIRSHQKIIEDVSKADKTFYLFYGYHKLKVDGVQEFLETAHINNITFIYPPSPLTSQIADVPPEFICNDDKFPCDEKKAEICQCTHVIDVTLGSVVELILVHYENTPRRNHIFHLHGHKFFILGRRKFDTFQTTDEIKDTDRAGKLISRNLLNLVKKDTLMIPAGGLAVIRFLADNTGYWLLQEEGNSHGMEIIFNVIGSQQKIPDSFPRCGNWIGPKYFFA